MKYTKTFKIGEYAKGGIITAEVNNKVVTIIGKEWDHSKGDRRSSDQSGAKEWINYSIVATDSTARWKIDDFLNDLTSSYYSDQILKWIETKVKFETNLRW